MSGQVNVWRGSENITTPAWFHAGVVLRTCYRWPSTGKKLCCFLRLACLRLSKGGRRLPLGRCLCAGDQLDCNHLRGISNTPTSFHDPGISTGTILEPPGYIVEQFGYDGFGAQKLKGASTRRKRPFLSQCNHAIGKPSNFLGLCLRGLDSLVVQQGRHEITKQGPSMLRSPPELSTFFPVSHSIPFGL